MANHSAQYPANASRGKHIHLPTWPATLHSTRPMRAAGSMFSYPYSLPLCTVPGQREPREVGSVTHMACHSAQCPANTRAAGSKFSYPHGQPATLHSTRPTRAAESRFSYPHGLPLCIVPGQRKLREASLVTHMASQPLCTIPGQRELREACSVTHMACHSIQYPANASRGKQA